MSKSKFVRISSWTYNPKIHGRANPVSSSENFGHARTLLVRRFVRIDGFFGPVAANLAAESAKRLGEALLRNGRRTAHNYL